MNKPSKKVWRIIRGKSISEKDHTTLRNSSFINDLFKLQWNRDSLPHESRNEEPDFEKVWQKIKNESYNKDGNSSRTIALNLLKYAAVLLIAFFSFYMGTRIELPGNKNITEKLDFYCPRGAKTELRLPDNSRVWLNSRSSIEYDENYGVNNRDIQLKGEAIFEVNENKDLPFTVNVNGSKITALGTEFYVSAYSFNNFLSAGLLEGSIHISVKENNVVVSDPGSFSFNKENGSLISEGELIPSFYEWKNGKLIFENTPLSEIAHRMSNWFDYNITVQKEISNQKFTLTIEDENIGEVLELIELASRVKYEKTEKGYRIYSR